MQQAPREGRWLDTHPAGRAALPALRTRARRPHGRASLGRSESHWGKQDGKVDRWRPWSSWPRWSQLDVHLGHMGSRAMSIPNFPHPEAQNRALLGLSELPGSGLWGGPAPRSAPRRTLPQDPRAPTPGRPRGLAHCRLGGCPLAFFFFELLSVLSYLGPLNPSARHLSPQSLSAAPDANSTGGNAFKVAPAPMKETSKLREPVLAAHAGWNGPPPPGRSAP